MAFRLGLRPTFLQAPRTGARSATITREDRPALCPAGFSARAASLAEPLPNPLVHRHLMLRAFIFDIYNTLLEVRPPQVNGELRWSELCRKLPGAPVLPLREFNLKCQQLIGQ